METKSPVRVALLIGGILGALGVGVGAYTAHGLEKHLKTREVNANSGEETLTEAQIDAKVRKRVGQADVGVRYQLIHCVAIIAIASVAGHYTTRSFKFIITLMTLGILLFSGSLYLLVMLDLPIMGAVTPIGGLSFIIGWLCLAILARAS